MDNQIDPLFRYLAMAGIKKNLPESCLAQVEADRAAYGDEYVADAGCTLAMGPLAVRFLHEVCGLSFDEARACIIEVIRDGGCFRFKSILCPGTVASHFMSENGNIFSAIAAVELFLEAAEGTPWENYWENVLRVLRTATPICLTEERPDDATLH